MAFNPGDDNLSGITDRPWMEQQQCCPALLPNHHHAHLFGGSAWSAALRSCQSIPLAIST